MKNIFYKFASPMNLDLIRKHGFSKVLCLLIALIILDLSVGRCNPGIELIEDRCNSEVNEMESISEIICEHVLEMKNFFPEDDDHNANEHTRVNLHLKIHFFSQPLAEVCTPAPSVTSFSTEMNEALYDQFIVNILKPPPRV